MKNTLVFFLLLYYFQTNAQDSIRVTLCTNDYDGCNPSYSKDVEHFDSLGRIIEIEHFYKNGCNNPGDSMMQFTSSNLYTYDIYGNVIVDEVRIATSSSVILKSYDSFGRLIANVYQQVVSGNTQVTGRDSTIYDTNGNKIWFLSETYNGSVWDTIKYYTWQFDINDRLIHVYKEEPFNIVEYFYQHDTIPYQITTYRSYISNGSLIDSTRVLKKYYSHNRLQEYWNSLWDNFAQAWIFIDRTSYQYDTIANITYQYQFDCPDTLCQDSIEKYVFTYDLLGRQIDMEYYESNGGWMLMGNSYTHYSGNLILGDGYHDTEQGCDNAEYNDYSYNMNNHLIHSHSIQWNCNPDTITCDYYILTGDSMLLANQGTLNACASDTIYPVVSLAGGHQPFVLQWSPSNGILDPDSLLPRIITDSSITYQLTVTDSIGTTQTVSIPVNVMQSNFNLGADTIVCRNDPLVLSANGSYQSYLWSTGSVNVVTTVNTSVPGTQSIWLTVQEMQCFYTDTINVSVNICNGISNVLNDNISIYPNPSNGNVTLQLNHISPQELIIIDNTGRIIERLDVTEKIFTLKLKPGIYFARLRSKEEIFFAKIIVN